MDIMMSKFQAVIDNSSEEDSMGEKEVLNKQPMKITNLLLYSSVDKLQENYEIQKHPNIITEEEYLKLNSNLASSDLRFINLEKYNELKEQKIFNPMAEGIMNNNNINKFGVAIKNQIFNIKKTLKLGRIKKNSTKKGKHDKFQRDNIIRKFKVLLMKNIYNYINNSFSINKKKYKKRKVLQKLSSYNTKSISKKDNIIWLNSPVRIVFSQKLSTKLSNFEQDFNEKLINNVYQEKKEKKVIEILDKTMREMWLAYISDDIEKKNIGFTTLKDDINAFREKGETEYYISLYSYVAHNFEKIFNSIIPRK